MTKEEKAFKLWLPAVSFLLVVGVYVWTSATRFQTIDSRSTENAKDISDIRKDNSDKFNRINDKLDVLISKAR